MLYIRQWCLSPLQSRHRGTSHNLPSVSSTVQNTLQNPLLELSSAAPSYFPESHQWSEIYSLSKVILVLGKARSCRAPTLGYMGVEPPGRFNVSPQNCTRHDVWAGVLLWWSWQSPVAHSCSLLNYPSRLCGGIFKLNAKFDADSLLYSLSHFECDGHTGHMLTQWHLPHPLPSTVKLSLFTHVRSSPHFLAASLHLCCVNRFCYINNGWTFPGQISYSFFFLKILLIYFREEGRRERNIYWLPLAHASTGDRICNPSMSPDQESNQQSAPLWDGAQSAEPHWSGQEQCILYFLSLLLGTLKILFWSLSYFRYLVNLVICLYLQVKQ